MLNNIFKKIVKLILPKGIPLPILKGSLRGYKFIYGAAPGEYGGGSVYLNRVEVEQSTFVRNILKENGIFFDIGANVGYYSLLASKCVGEGGIVFSFEPHIGNIMYLEKHRRLNKISNIHIMPFACSNNSNLNWFEIGANSGVGKISHGMSSSHHSVFKKYELVYSMDIDSIVKILGFGPDLMKIDVEGEELLVVRGSRKTIVKYRPKILLSAHSDELKSECEEIFKEMKYKSEVISHRGVDWELYYYPSEDTVI